MDSRQQEDVGGGGGAGEGVGVGVEGTGARVGQRGSDIEEEIEALALSLLQLQANSDVFFLLVMGMIVFFMQCGFAFLEAGAVRSKNTINILVKNMLDVFIGGISYWLVGYPLAFGEGNAFCGASYWASSGLPEDRLAHWFFHIVFSATAATIVSGAVAERCDLSAYIAYSVALTGIVYPIVSHWAWAPNGWLVSLGYRDFAGSGVVHVTGGVAALVGAALLGPRHASFGKGRRVIRGHSLPLTALGGFIILFGFLAFTCGSQGTITRDGDAQVRNVIGKFVRNVIGKFVRNVIGKFVRNVIGRFVRNTIGKFVRNVIGKFVRNVTGKFVRNVIGKFVRNVIGKFVRNVIGKFVRNVIGKFVRNVIGKFVRNDIGKCVRNVIGKFVRNVIGKFVRNVIGKFVRNVIGKFVRNVIGKFVRNVIGKFVRNTIEKFVRNVIGKFVRIVIGKFLRNTIGKFVRSVVGRAVFNTALAGCSGGVCALLLHRAGLRRSRAWSFLMALNGAMTGMVSSCAGCNALRPWASCLTGVAAGLVFFAGHHLLLRLNVDDPLDAVPVHLGGGLWGLAAAALLQDGGLFYGGSAGVLVWNVVGGLAIVCWSGGLSLAVFGALKRSGNLRVSLAVEVRGLDLVKHGEAAYPSEAWEESQYFCHISSGSDHRARPPPWLPKYPTFPPARRPRPQSHNHYQRPQKDAHDAQGAHEESSSVRADGGVSKREGSGE
ncbi:putative ammonium transporter 1 [Penaeus monodon]|uniref:putative ammonium transporter 1 n=1 Tax=Penaeus monodon TaxID=6687 RepID=UPI0018A787A0|nr:putative ammonium transporter 1 [Penaeus monodon]